MTQLSAQQEALAFSEKSLQFLPLNLTHRALLLKWLNAPHNAAWWGKADEEIEDIFSTAEHQPFIAAINLHPIAYLQSWRPSQDPDYKWQHRLPETERGIDIMIGEAANLGQGLGPFLVKSFAQKLFAEGATRVLIDPDLKNERAIFAFLKAGFTPYAEVISAGRPALVMEIVKGEFDYGE